MAANLFGADLTDADFSNADLSLANMTDAVITGANFLAADMSGCIGINGRPWGAAIRRPIVSRRWWRAGLGSVIQ